MTAPSKPDHIPERPAQIGDRGTIIGNKGEGLSSGIATLLISVTESNGQQWIVTLMGDHRLITMLADTFTGHKVEIVEGEGSGYGCHNVRVID